MLTANPYSLLFAPYSRPGSVTAYDYLGYAATCLGLSLALVMLAVWKVRPVTIRQTARAAKARDRRVLTTPESGWNRRLHPLLDRDPVLWRELRRRAPSVWSRWIFRYIYQP